jgi:hypothetical protein
MMPMGLARAKRVDWGTGGKGLRERAVKNGKRVRQVN